jgi:polygalacturonase
MFDTGAARKYSAEVYQHSSRREFLGMAAALSIARARADEPSGWESVPGILARIQAPRFPAREFDIAKYGARPDGQTDSTAALAQAIAACSKAGGGRVVVPPGVYLTAAIRLESNVDLHVSAGATLRFLQDPARYLPLVATRFEGVELMNYSPFIYADGARNIAITGEGTLDGNADNEHWWPWKGNKNFGWKAGQPKDDARKTLFDMGQNDVPLARRVFGEGSYLRPNFIQPHRCSNVLIEGVTIVRSPMWEITPYDCTNVTVRGVHIDSHGPNNDGVDPDSCRDVLIENCIFDTGDDCIAIKSGRDRDGRRVGKPTENVIIRNCVMKDGHGGITIGSEMSGGVRNVFAEKCRLSSPNLNQALRFKTNAMRGGAIENVWFRDIEIGQVSDAVLQVDFYYETGPDGPERPVVRDIHIERLKADKAKYALYLRAFPNAPVRNVHLADCAISHVEKENVIEHVEGLVLDRVRITKT